MSAALGVLSGEVLADHATGGGSAVASLFGASFCEHPVRLAGIGVNRNTGEITEAGRYVRCKTRRRSRCLSCSSLYARDAYSVIVSGWSERESYLWLTLTAPGYGCQHHHGSGEDGTKRCSPKRSCPGCGKDVPPCRKFHERGDPLIGVPVCDCFDYESAAAFNAAAPSLWTRTMKELNEAFPQSDGRLQYIKVVEWQRRGLIHFHALIRGIAESEEARAAISRVRLNEIGWGNIDAQVLSPGDERSARKRFSYIVKYAVKSVADNMAEKSQPLLAHYERFRAAAPDDCRCRQDARQESDHTRQCRILRTRSEGLGFGGHVLTKSQKWGLSFLAVRQRRRQWMADKNAEGAIQWEWKMRGNGYKLPSASERIWLSRFFNDLRRRSRAPASFYHRLPTLFLGSIEDETGISTLLIAPTGDLITTNRR